MAEYDLDDRAFAEAETVWCKHCRTWINCGGKRSAKTKNLTAPRAHWRKCEGATAAQREWWRQTGNWNMPKRFGLEYERLRSRWLR